MKLSIAILRGCVIRPKHYRDGLFGAEGSCVLGAAYEGKFGKITPQEHELLKNKFWMGVGDYYRHLCSAFPCLQENDKEMMFEILTMDKTRSREEIAEWLSKQGL